RRMLDHDVFADAQRERPAGAEGDAASERRNERVVEELELAVERPRVSIHLYDESERGQDTKRQARASAPYELALQERQQVTFTEPCRCQLAAQVAAIAEPSLSRDDCGDVDSIAAVEPVRLSHRHFHRQRDAYCGTVRSVCRVSKRERSVGEPLCRCVEIDEGFTGSPVVQAQAILRLNRTCSFRQAKRV